MDLDLKVPFARRRADGAVVGVADVPRGLAANCDCLSCRRPLIARQGEVNAWHFAHDFSAGQTELCEYSQMESIREAISWLLPQLDTIRVPAIKDRPAKQVQYASLSNAPEVDACIELGDFRLLLWFGYSQRPWLGDETELDDKTGLLILSIDKLVAHEATKISSIERLRRWLLEEDLAKFWHYHPLLVRVPSDASMAEDDQDDDLAKSLDYDRLLTQKRLATSGPYEHQCVICDASWFGESDRESLTCIDCGTHLYVSSKYLGSSGKS